MAKKTRRRSRQREPGLAETMRLALDAKCDPDIYLYLSQVYAAAAHRTMPIKGGPFRAPDEPGPWLVLTDRPINRGMLAVAGELRSMKIDGPLSHAYFLRIMDFGEIFEHREQLGEFIRDSDEAGAVMVGEALIRAVALAKYVTEGDRSRLDIDSVLEHARRIEAEDDAKREDAPRDGSPLNPPAPKAKAKRGLH